MTPATRTAPAPGGHRVRLLAVLLAAILALLAGAAAHTTPHPRAATATAATPRTHRTATMVRAVLRPAATAARDHGHAAAAAPTSITIQLQQGDTLGALAARYHTTVTALQNANHLGASTLIYAGAHLTIPLTHTAPTPAHTTASSAAPATTGRTAAVAFAVRQLGTPYLWGGTGDGGYDCSGLVQAAWHAAGVDLPRTTTAQANAGTRITRDQLQPGDLVFTNSYDHVQLYAGAGRVIEAAHTGTLIRYAPLPTSTAVDAYVRVHASTTTTTTASYGRAPSASAPPAGTAQQAATQVFGTQYACAAAIITRESGWDPTATNPASGAYGLAQALPAAKMAAFGPDWRTDPATQLTWMRAYVDARYGGACAAWTYWQTHHWY
jgi:cell wall-associated NlpC family hydrolase